MLGETKLARLAKELDKLTIFGLDVMENIGEFTHFKRKTEECGTHLNNPVHKLLGKLPSFFEYLKDNLFLCEQLPSFEETVSIIHDKCIT